MGKSSDAVQTSWITADNGAFLMKIKLTFANYLTFAQNIQLCCTLA